MSKPDYLYSHPMRGWKVALVLIAAGCSSAGTQALPGEAGADATTAGDDASNEGGSDAGVDGSVAPCYPVPVRGTVASQDCVYAGACPADCIAGSASAYACTAPDSLDAAASYPAVFTAPSSIVTVVGTTTNAYPWDAAAFVSCAPLTCVRWASADHLSPLAPSFGDPCAGDGDVDYAWVCPAFAGVLPPLGGCFNSGGLIALGGVDTGIPSQNVWCCPRPLEEDAGAPSDASLDGTNDAGSMAEAAVDAAATE